MWPAPLSSLCHRQWEAEEKSRQQRTVVLADHDGQGTDDDDAASTKGGVLHEEDFVETKAGAGAGGHDVEAPRGSSQQEEGLLAVLKIVDWWKVCCTARTALSLHHFSIS